MDYNNIINGNCLDVLKDIPDKSVDLIITSPPYADRRKKSYDSIPADQYVEWFIPIAQEIYRVLKNDGSFFLNIKPHCEDGQRVLYVFELVLSLCRTVSFRFVDEFCWTKNGVPGKFKGRFKNSHEPIYHFSKSPDFKFFPYEVASPAKEVSLKRYKRKACGGSLNGSGFAGMRKEITSTVALPSNHLNICQKTNQYTMQKNHPAIFPVELVEFFIKAFSQEKDVVLDPFSGSGTTAIACLNTNRQYICIDNKQEYIDLSLKRISSYFAE